MQWKLTTFLFVVSFLELAIIGLYLSVDIQPSRMAPQQAGGPIFVIPGPAGLPMQEKRQPTFPELFKEGSGIEKRLPKLLHDHFKHTDPAGFSPAELVGLLNLEMNHIKQYSFSSEAVVVNINPHNPALETDIVSIAIKKELLKTELKDEYLLAESPKPVKPDVEITAPPPPGNAINPQQKMLALTFDDGPDGNTHALLDALNKYEANATFFVLGQKVPGADAVLQRMLREGNEIGNHTWNHPDLRYLSPAQLAWQVQETQRAIQVATGVTPTQMRPPYGATNPAITQFLQSQGLAQAMWSIDSNDWRDRDPELLYQRIMGGTSDGAVILLHDIHTASVQAAIRAIPELKAQGYQLVTISQRNHYR